MSEVNKFDINTVSSDIKVNSKMLDKSVTDLISTAGGGSVTNYPDEEDLTSVTNENGISIIRQKDRDSGDGMGYVILRKNKSIISQVTKSNTIYEIRYDFNLNKYSLNMPENCILKFNGGSILNGSINFNNTNLTGNVNISTEIYGTISNDVVYVNWFTHPDFSHTLQVICDSHPSEIHFGNKTYQFKNVIINNSILIKGSNETIFKPFIVPDGYQNFNIYPCENMLKSTKPNVKITIDNIIFKSVISNATSLPIIKTDNPCSKPLLWFINSREINIKNCSFIDIEGNSYQSTSYTYYGNKMGMCLCCWDVDKTVIDSNYVRNIRFDEQFWVIAVDKEREKICVDFINNKIEDVNAISNSSLFSCVCGTVNFKNNFIDGFNYKGSLTNLFGLNVFASNNIVINSNITNIFDTSEYGYFYSDNVIIDNNIASGPNCKFLITIARKIHLSNNVFRGFVFLISEQDAAITHPIEYKHFYDKDNIKDTNVYVLIENNDIDLTWYNGSQTFNNIHIYARGIYIKPYFNMGDKVIIRNNNIKKLTVYPDNDINDVSNNSTIPIYIYNINNVFIENNTFEGTGMFEKSITSQKSYMYIGLRTTHDNYLHDTINHISICNNNFKDTVFSYIMHLMDYNYNTKVSKINYFDFSNNIINADSCVLNYSVNIYVLFGNIYNNSTVLSSLYNPIFVRLYTDLTNIPIYSQGLLNGFECFKNNDNIVFAKDSTSYYKYKISSLIENESVIMTGEQIELEDGSIWKCLGKTTYQPNIQYINDKLFKMNNYYFIKLYAKKIEYNTDGTMTTKVSII